jgi:hypothetical protein
LEVVIKNLSKVDIGDVRPEAYLEKFAKTTASVTMRQPRPKAQPATARVQVKRYRERGCYDRQTIYRILDAGFLCQIGFIFDGAPVVIPTLYWRAGAYLYLHGSNSSRMLKSIEGNAICFSTTQLDGLVLAKSAFRVSPFRQLPIGDRICASNSNYGAEGQSHPPSALYAKTGSRSMGRAAADQAERNSSDDDSASTHQRMFGQGQDRWADR